VTDSILIKIVNFKEIWTFDRKIIWNTNSKTKFITEM